MNQGARNNYWLYLYIFLFLVLVFRIENRKTVGFPQRVRLYGGVCCMEEWRERDAQNILFYGGCSVYF